MHLPSKFAEELFAVSPMGMTVVVVDERTAPQHVVHPPMFAPLDQSGRIEASRPIDADATFRLEPEKAPHGPVSILISAADERIVVLRNGREIGRARISVRDPSVPLGTHTFVLREAPQDAEPAWVAVAMPGHLGDAGWVLSHEAAARVDVPQGFARAVSLLLAPGATLFVTDAPILTENMHPDYTVLSNRAPPAAGD